MQIFHYFNKIIGICKFSAAINPKSWTFLWVWIFFAFLRPVYIFSEDTELDLGKLFFSVSPRILENGTITDIGFGYRYNEKYSQRLNFSFSNESKNEEFKSEGVEDSLNARTEKNYELFLFPVELTFLRSSVTELKASAGIYYNYNILTEKGFFNMPSLEVLGKERVNSFTNDFSMHTLGPCIEIAYSNRAEYFELSSRAGIVPVFYFWSKQKMGMVPLLDPLYAEYTQDNFGSPYVYADINIIILKYFSFSFLYDFSRLQYQVIDFDDDLKWYNPSRKVLSNSFKLEGSLLIPMMNSVYTKIGLGYSWVSIQQDTAAPIWNKQFYLVFNTSIR